MGGVYQNRVVAFVDILGFRELVNASVANDGICATIHQVLTGTEYKLMRHYHEAEKRGGDLRKTSFSDSVVVSDIGNIDGLLRVIGVVCEIVLKLQFHGVLCRGGIDFGSLFHTDDAVFGPALIRAYDIETKVAEFPQIVFSKSCIDMVESSDDEEKKIEGLVWHFAIFDKKSKVVRLDPFYMVKNKYMADWAGLPFSADEFFTKLMDSTKSHLRSNIDNPKIFSKYEWFAAQINEYVRVHFPALGQIDVSKIFPGFEIRCEVGEVIRREALIEM